MESEEEYDETELETLISSGAIDKQVNVKDYIFSLYITNNLRQIFILVMLVGNFISINIAIIFMCLAWYVRSSVEKHISFMHDFYNPHAVPTTVGLSGVIMLVTSVLGVKAALGGRMMDDESDIKLTAEFMFIYAVAAAVAFVAVLITTLTCFIEIAILSAALGEGLLSGMKKYKTEPEFKPEIDALQTTYKCCGSKSYKDWYNISWVASKYLETGSQSYMGKDVPFSCCRLGVMRPCVDTRVEDSSYNSKYQYPADLTLYERGCKEAVSNFLGHTVYKGVGLFVFFCCFLWITLAVIGRYFNTSMENTYFGEPPIGWLVPYIKSKKGGTSKSTRSVAVFEEESEESESEE